MFTITAKRTVFDADEARRRLAAAFDVLLEKTAGAGKVGDQDQRTAAGDPAAFQRQDQDALYHTFTSRDR